MIRPEIIIKVYEPDETALKEVLAGIEEEGVLHKVIREETPDTAFRLGQRAALMSQLETGIGINGQKATLYIQKIKDTPLFTTALNHRSIGQNAGRYVKGNPLMEL